MKLSIIIPAYNVEKLIVRCLGSVVNQDLLSNEYEIIIVDDGSVDKTYKVAKEFCLNRSNTFLLKQKNQKQGAARNNALKIAKGEYIWFVDSDDFIVKNVLSRLYTTAKKMNLDLLCFSNLRIDQKNLITKDNIAENIIPNKIYTGKEIINLKSINCGPCFCIFKREFLFNNELKFKEGVFYEDNEFMLKSYFFAKKVSYINSPYYYVFLSPNSSTRNLSSKPIFDIIKVVSDMLYFTNKLDDKDVSKTNCYYYCVMTFNTALNKLKYQNKDIKNDFREKIKPIKKQLTKAMFKSKNLKYIIEAILLYISFNFLQKISKI